MTVKLLAAYGQIPPNAIVTLDAGTETGLVAAKQADTNLTGGVLYVAPTNPNKTVPAQIEMNPTTGAVMGISDAGGLIRIRKLPRSLGAMFCDWQPVSGAWTATSANAGESVALDPAVVLDGFPAVKVTFSTVPSTTAAQSTLNYTYTLTNPVSLKNFTTMQLPVKVTGLDTTAGMSSFAIWLILANSGGTVVGSARVKLNFSDIPPGGIHNLSFSKYATNVDPGGIQMSGVTFTGNGSSFDTLFVTKLQLVVVTNNANGTFNPNANPIWFGPLRAGGRAPGRVSIVMDGNYISQYTVIKPALDKYGMKASLALVTNTIGTDATQYMDWSQVREMAGQGYEPIHHTFDNSGGKTLGYVDANTWTSAAAITADIRSQQGVFIQEGWYEGLGVAAAGYGSPFTGTVTPARQRLLWEAYRSAGVEFLRHGNAVDKQMINVGNKAHVPFTLRGSLQAGFTTLAAQIIALFDQAEANGEWMILTLHRAVATTAINPGTDILTRELLPAIDELGTRHRAGRLIVAPLAKSCNELYK